MNKPSFLKVICVVFFFVMTAIASSAQTFTTLHIFGRSQGAFPGALVQATDGNLYGTIAAGGSDNDGVAYKITLTGQLTALQSFDVTNGNSANALLQGLDGNFYGTTGEGGANFGGTFFKITAAGVLTTLYSFCAEANCTDGTIPIGGLVQAANGNFYGTTEEGGTNNAGTVFQITPAGTLSTLYSFCALTKCIDGEIPQSGLIRATDGNFYGTTEGGGTGTSCALRCGTVFKITPAGRLTTLHSFCAQAKCPDGNYPFAALVQGANGDFYGTTNEGGANLSGTVFQITPAGILTTLYSFCAQSNCADGEEPFSGLVEGTDGNFYGTTPRGGEYEGGTVFQMTPAGTLTTLHNFCSQMNAKRFCTDGMQPTWPPVQDTDGTFYGTTADGGGTNVGTFYSVSTGLGPFVKTNPTSGKVGAKVIILGNNLTGTTNVSFNGVTATVLKVTASAIEVSVPAGATTGTVTVMTPSGTLDSNVAFQVLP